MIKADLLFLLPQMILATASLILMIAVAIKRNYLVVNSIALLAFLLAFLAVVWIEGPITEEIGSLFIFDGFGRLFMGLILAGGFLISLLSCSYLKSKTIIKEEYFILLLLATLGATCMVISNHFVSFFLSLELLSISLYALIAYLKEKSTAIEAGIKYLILAAVSTSFFLFGVALIYAQTGELDFNFASINLKGDAITNLYFLAGMALVLVGILFKLGLVPFHLWTSDVYAGASPPITAFIATISKGSVFAFLIRLFFNLEVFNGHSIWLAFAIIAVASMLIGNWLALKEQNVKRLLAFSSIAHMGYLMVAFLAISRIGDQAAALYLIGYFITMIGAFAVVTILSEGVVLSEGRMLSEKDTEAESIEDYKGLYQRKPALAVFFTAMLLSLAGVPLTAGFMANFYLLEAGASSGLWFLLIILVLSSIIGLFYYLRVIIALFSKQKSPITCRRISLLNGIVLLVLFIALIWIGIFPDGILSIIERLI